MKLPRLLLVQCFLEGFRSPMEASLKLFMCPLLLLGKAQSSGKTVKSTACFQLRSCLPKCSDEKGQHFIRKLEVSRNHCLIVSIHQAKIGTLPKLIRWQIIQPLHCLLCFHLNLFVSFLLYILSVLFFFFKVKCNTVQIFQLSIKNYIKFVNKLHIYQVLASDSGVFSLML